MYRVGALLTAPGSTIPTNSGTSILNPIAVEDEVIAATAFSTKSRLVVPPSVDVQKRITFAVPAPIALTSFTTTRLILLPTPLAAATAGPAQRVVVVDGAERLVSVLATEKSSIIGCVVYCGCVAIYLSLNESHII
jgi:hypothetical protein